VLNRCSEEYCSEQTNELDTDLREKTRNWEAGSPDEYRRSPENTLRKSPSRANDQASRPEIVELLRLSCDWSFSLVVNERSGSQRRQGNSWGKCMCNSTLACFLIPTSVGFRSTNTSHPESSEIAQLPQSKNRKKLQLAPINLI
jgi:hypothetical protein